MLAVAGTLVLGNEALADPALIPIAAMVAVAAAGLTWGALWLWRGRMEWRIESGGLTLQRRYGSSVSDTFVARALELTARSDSDGDRWFSLDALAHTAAEPGGGPSRQNRRRIATAIHDPTVPRRLGAWLAHRTRMPFHDRTGENTRATELARLRAELPSTGRIGRLAARLIEQAEAREREREVRRAKRLSARLPQSTRRSAPPPPLHPR